MNLKKDNSGMREKIKDILKWRPDDRLTAIGLVLLVLVALYPLVRLTLYTVPFYDDYAYGLYAHNTVLNGDGILEYIKMAGEHTRQMWYAYQGTFSSIFFMSLMPGAMGEQYYFLGPLFLICIFVFSICIFVRTLVKGVLKADRWQTIQVQAITVAFLITLIHSAQQAFYWFNGGMHYVGGYSHMLLFLSAAIYLLFIAEFDFKSLKGKLRCAGWILLSMIYALLTSGSNFVTTLQGLVLMLSIVGLAVLVRKKRAFLGLPMTVVYLIGFLYNVGAPGNNVRSGEYDGWGYSAIEAVLYSFVEAGKWFFKFCGIGTLLFGILLFPVIWKIVKKTSFQFKYPLLILVWSVCVYATGFTPSLYATGRIDLSRVRNVIQFTLQFLLILNEFYLTGYIARRMAEKKSKAVQWSGRVVWWSYGVWAACLLCLFVVTEDKIGSFAPFGAYYYIHSGEANNYRQAYLERVKQIEEGPEDIVLTEYIYKPWFLCQGDMSADPNAEINVLTARYYHKKSICVVAREE